MAVRLEGLEPAIYSSTYPFLALPAITRPGWEKREEGGRKSCKRKRGKGKKEDAAPDSRSSPPSTIPARITCCRRGKKGGKAPRKKKKRGGRKEKGREARRLFPLSFLVWARPFYIICIVEERGGEGVITPKKKKKKGGKEMKARRRLCHFPPFYYTSRVAFTDTSTGEKKGRSPQGEKKRETEKEGVARPGDLLLFSPLLRIAVVAGKAVKGGEKELLKEEKNGRYGVPCPFTSPLFQRRHCTCDHGK